MRATMQEKEVTASGNNSEHEAHLCSTDSELKALKAELEAVKTKMTELQSDYAELQQECDRLGSGRHKNTPRWSASWRKIKSSFHSKADGDEEFIEAPQEEMPRRHKTSFLRRLSIT